MPKRELTKTEKGVLGFFVALAALFGIRHLAEGAPPILKGKLSKGGIYVI